MSRATTGKALGPGYQTAEVQERLKFVLGENQTEREQTLATYALDFLYTAMFWNAFEDWRPKPAFEIQFPYRRDPGTV